MTKTLKEFLGLSYEDIKLSNEDFDTFYAELVCFVKRDRSNAVEHVVYAYISGRYPTLPVTIAFDLVYKLFDDGFIK